MKVSIHHFRPKSIEYYTERQGSWGMYGSFGNYYSVITI